MMTLEKKHGRRSGCVYLYDMKEMRFQPGLLPIIAGTLYQRMRICTALFPGPLTKAISCVLQQHPEMIVCVSVVNVPRFIQVLYNAFKPMLPQRTANKVVHFHVNYPQNKSNEHLQSFHQNYEHIQSLVAPHKLPAKYGGTLVGSFDSFEHTNFVIDRSVPTVMRSVAAF